MVQNDLAYPERARYFTRHHTSLSLHALSGGDRAGQIRQLGQDRARFCPGSVGETSSPGSQSGMLSRPPSRSVTYNYPSSAKGATLPEVTPSGVTTSGNGPVAWEIGPVCFSMRVESKHALKSSAAATYHGAPG